MVPQIPRSGSGSPCEATSNGLCHGISLCALKEQICVSVKCFRCELAVVPQARTALCAKTQESRERGGGRKMKTMADCKGSSFSDAGSFRAVPDNSSVDQWQGEAFIVLSTVRCDRWERVGLTSERWRRHTQRDVGEREKGEEKKANSVGEILQL